MGLFDRILGGKTQNGGDSAEFRQLVEKAMHHLRALTASHEGMWRMGECSWGADLDAGIITFDSPHGMHVEAPVQIVGTYDTNDGTWLWGWDHPSVEPPLDQHAQAMLAYGRQRQLADLTTRKIRCSEERCWEFTAVACLLANAQGAYRGPSGTTMVFMTFGKVTLSRAE